MSAWRARLNPVRSVASILQQAQKIARIEPEQLAAWARLDEHVLHDAMAGRSSLTAAELDRVARVFGLRLHDLLEGEVGTAPMTLLLRSTVGDPALDIRGLLTIEVDHVLGEFQRVVRDVTELGEVVGLPSWDVSRDASLSVPAREELGRGSSARGARVPWSWVGPNSIDDPGPHVLGGLHRVG